MLATLDYYLFKEVIKATLAFLLVIVLILSSHLFVRVLESAAAGELGPQVLFPLLGLELLKQIPRMVPPAFFFSILFTLGRMYRDSEMVALTSCGVGTLRIYRAFLISALLVAGGVTWLSMVTMPWATRVVAELRHQQKEAVNLAGIETGQFNEFNKGDLVFYAEDLSTDAASMRQIFVQKRQPGRVGLITAEKGYQYVDPESGDRFMVLENGYRYLGIAGRGDYSVGKFAKYAVRISQAKEKLQRVRHREKPTRELLVSQDPVDHAEFQFRLSLPLAVLAFTALSVPLSRSLPRQGMFGRLLMAFILYFIFINLQDVSEKWMEEGLTPKILGMWWVHILMLMIGSAMHLPDSRWYRVLRHRLRRSTRS